MSKRRAAAIWLYFGAAALAMVGYFMWGAAGDDADQAARTAELTRAMLLDEGMTVQAAAVDVDPEPDRTGAMVVLAGAGVAAVCATVLFAGSSPDARRPPTEAGGRSPRHGRVTSEG